MRRPARCLRARMWCRAMVCDDACVPHHACIGRRVTPHVLRRTLAMTAIQKGISLPALQRLLGHDHGGGGPRVSGEMVKSSVRTIDVPASRRRLRAVPDPLHERGMLPARDDDRFE
jgi:integrase